MTSPVGFAAIRSRPGEMPEGAIPGNPAFSENNALQYIIANVDKDLIHIAEANRRGADLAATVEGFAGDGAYMNELDDTDLFKNIVARSEKIIHDKISEAARNLKMLIAANYYTTVDNLIYNTAVLYGRGGEVIGRYLKVHLPAGEARLVAAGTEFPVFDTDIGRIGFATCYDIIISEQFRILAVNGADIIVHQSMAWGPDGRGVPVIGDAYMRTRANENSVYLVVANNITKYGGRSCIVDPDGNFIAEAGGMDEGLAYAKVIPDYDRHDSYFYDNYFSDVPSTRARQLLVRRPELYGALTSDNTYSHRRDGMYKLPSPERETEIFREHAAMDRETQRKYFWGIPHESAANREGDK